MRSLAPVLVLVLGCRPGPGDPSYPDITPFQDTDTEGRLPGDDPWDGTSPRLSLSAFYEGGATEVLLIDDETVNYYIYEGSYTQQTSGERVEGLVSDLLTVNRDAWWGGGIHLDGRGPADLTGWTTLHVALRSEDPAMEAFQIGMVGSVGEGRITASDYGFAADGDWHVVEVPLADLAGSVGLDAVTVALLLIAPTGESGTSLLIDDLYLTAEE